MAANVRVQPVHHSHEETEYKGVLALPGTSHINTIEQITSTKTKLFARYLKAGKTSYLDHASRTPV